MTDEEMAEEYICNGKCQDDITRNYVHCKTCTRIKGFLAGLKAGRPQWHKVADGDLPRIINDYFSNDLIFLTKDCSGNITTHFGYFNLWKVFEEYNTEDKFIPDEVIAWCEIPTFDKE